MTSLGGLLRHNANYRYTWMAQVVSEIGDYFNNIAVFALVMEKSGSGLVVTGVMLSRAIPAVLGGPGPGGVAERRGRQNNNNAGGPGRRPLALGVVVGVRYTPPR